MSHELTTQTVRELKGAPLSVYLVLLLTTTMPVRQEWIERATGYTDKPVSQALAYLQETGRVVETKTGWQIATAVQLPLSAPALQEADERSSRNNSDSMQNSLPFSVLQDAPIQQNGPLSRNNSDSNTPESELFRLKTGSIINDDDDFKDIKDSSSSSFLNLPEVGKFPTLKTVLENMVLVFGDGLSESDVPAGTKPELALAWIGKAYQDHLSNGLANPIGLIRARLKAQAARKLHLDHLPAVYLEAIGLWRESCPMCGLELCSREDLNAHLIQPHDVEPEPSSNVQLISDIALDEAMDHIGISINEVWEQVLSRMQADMARASFDTWLRDTRPCGWDADAAEITVAARNAYACEWLSNKAAETVASELSSILDRKVGVRFVCVSVETEA